MRVLVVGSGGREHALAWKISQSPRVTRLWVAPGNAGTALEAENVPIAADDIAGLVAFAKKESVDLVVVGPEVPLTLGLVDELAKVKIRAFGPSKAAAQLEGSKVFCKLLLRQADVPTADYQAFRDADSAMRYIKARYPNERDKASVVIKADGLASGKGVIVCSYRDEALEAIDRIGRKNEFGRAGSQMIIEERLEGPEASVLAITDGKTILTLPSAQDHKAAYDGDKGPNTGGMGAYSPTPVVSDDLFETIEDKILVPTIHTMKRNRKPFRGVLYAGLMLTQAGPKVLEYNVRFGDPECQPLLMRLQSDLLDILEATVDGRLDEIDPPVWDPRPAICVVVASQGYPGAYENGRPITGLEKAADLPDVKVFHAGTKLVDGTVVTNGGRVLGVTALGANLSAAKLNAYTAVQAVRWPGAWCRKDISDKAAAYLAASATES
ncbi:Phosphoribosylamine--glycine ligase [Pirellula sp. SH-Sr6A]|uniref:phosphoribosylamine--glycine ligase n=1 Tax=Pirellula sp. SH-Sr6A TaxID=1632865 RepID=UPI00078D8E32|nr:phosphoribosylamine--glycine ligase [Pirellula sp. SH-Sr6A]AMV31918.1 Phosphoribosylamine--glycine ligase [Pirellula sp. SH-Sr6A]